jgi:hypothetical protein
MHSAVDHDPPTRLESSFIGTLIQPLFGRISSQGQNMIARYAPIPGQPEQSSEALT